MLEEVKMDVVGICTPIELHYAPVIEAARKGVHIFCEKPLSHNLETAQEMVAFCQTQGIKLGVGFRFRYEAFTSLARNIVYDGSMGSVGFVFISYFQHLPKISWYLEWGTTLDNLVHAIDYVLWVFGKKPCQVFSEKEYLLGYKGEDKSFIVLDFDSGEKGIIGGGYLRDYPPIGGLHDFCFQIVSERGYILGIRPNHLFVCRDSEIEELSIETVDPFLLELEDFLEAIRGGKEPPVSGIDGLRAQTIIEGAKQSHLKREPVTFRATDFY